MFNKTYLFVSLDIPEVRALYKFEKRICKKQQDTVLIIITFTQILKYNP